MPARTLPAVILSALVLLPISARAEDNPEAQDARQQLQQAGRQAMQKMSEQGIDPRQLLGDIRQQMQDGTLDLQGLQQKMVDQGLIDKGTISQLQATAQNSTWSNIRRQLAVTDEEWAALQPKIQRVIILSGDADSSNPLRGALSGLMRGQQQPKSEAALRKQELQTAIENPETEAREFQVKLAALREARAKAKEELAVAQKDLIETLTIRQEALLVLLGLL